MNRLLQIVAKANAILFSFVIPFTIVYWRQENMFEHNEELRTLYASEISVRPHVALAETSNPIVPASPSHQASAAPKVHLAAASGFSHNYIDRVNADEATYILPIIAQCESGNDPYATNNSSSAKGLLQILDGTWKMFNCDGNVFDADDNMRCGMKIATLSGLHHWDPSRACWAPKL